MSDSIMSTIRTLQEQAAQLQSDLIEAKGEAQALFDDNTRLRNAIDRLVEEFGKQATDPILKNHRLGHDWAKLTPEHQAEQPMAEYACKKCGRPELDHMLWALSHLYKEGTIRLGYRASVTMRAMPQTTHAEHLFTTTTPRGIVPNDRVCSISGCQLAYGDALTAGLTVTASALAVLPWSKGDERP